MEREATEILLALRRLVAAPVPGAFWRLRAFLPVSELIRVRLEDDVSRAVLIELPHRPGVAPTSLGFWWYVGGLRGAARWVADNTEAGALDLGTFTAAGVLPAVVEVTTDDGLDYVVADLFGDPYWHAPAATVAPDLYHLVGFDTRHHGVARLYCALPERGFIEIDVGTTDPESGAFRPVGWRASTKLIALLNREASESLDALRVPEAEDPYCNAVYDATSWS
ncbi:hypothetical protein ACFY40_26635 [Streptomyces sp. NPDC012950]|uniref:hypothetical protein n=1 Tax=Streptomyces sp. NPDC012950 TaxID=3364858 RepID=UPI0036AF251A